MSLVIRLTRMGKKGERKFRLIVKEKRDRRDGKYLENLGWYEKKATGETKELHKDRIEYWISVGAQMTQTARQLVEAK